MRLRLPLPLCLALAAGSAAAHGEADHGQDALRAVAEQRAFGIAGNDRKAARTVLLAMTDAMRFQPAHLEVRRGETVRLVVRNEGRQLHELVIGTLGELREHAELMQRFPAMEHAEPHMVHVPPGTSGEIVWHFNRAGDFHFACLVAGHFEAGMTGTIKVR